MLKKIVQALVCLLLLVPVCGQAARSDINTGYSSLVTWLPGSQLRIDVAVWYPTSRSPQQITVGSWSFDSARNAPIYGGPWPLIVLSHDSTGSRFSHHDLAAALVRRGYIVAAPTHDGDNADDMRLLFTSEQLPARAAQISATIDLLLENPNLGPQILQNKISLLGFGNGGTAGLLLAGAAQTPELWSSYCRSVQNQEEASNPYCTPGIARNIDRMIQSMHTETAKIRETGLNYESALAARASLLQDAKTGVERAYGRVNRAQRRPVTVFPSPPVFLPLLPPIPVKSGVVDDRLGALILVSPGYAMIFDPDSLRNVSIPVLLVGAENDALNKYEQQGAVLKQYLGGPYAEAMLNGADGPSLQALCPPDLASGLTDLCNTVTPRQRDQIHVRLEEFVLAFLARI